jgi:hypothetical protein
LRSQAHIPPRQSAKEINRFSKTPSRFGFSIEYTTKFGEVIANKQLEIEMKTAIINFDSPLLVSDADKLVGIMWRSGVSKEGYSIGIVQLITK